MKCKGIARSGDRVEKFWGNVTKTASCWLWTGNAFPTGYGRFVYRNKATMATHVSWELARRPPLQPGECLLHRCDNPPCVNPDHLFAGTKGDNNSDAFAKGRHSTQVSAAVKARRFPKGNVPWNARHRPAS